MSTSEEFWKCGDQFGGVTFTEEQSMSLHEVWVLSGGDPHNLHPDREDVESGLRHLAMLEQEYEANKIRGAANPLVPIDLSRAMTNRAEALAKALQALLSEQDENQGHATCATYDSARAALEAYRSQPDGWQDISTAPKDGTPFLAWFPKVRLDEDDEPTDEVIGGAQALVSCLNDMWSEPDWLDAHGAYYFEDWCFADVPTVWQPLPAPPNSKEQK
jgi:hypothetical protein